MIYIENIDKEQRVMIPLPMEVSADAVTFQLVCSATREIICSVAVPTTIQGQYLSVDLLLEDVESGEYEYQVNQDGAIITSGLAKVEKGGVAYQTINGNIMYQEYEGK